MQTYINTDRITDQALAAQLLSTSFAGTVLAGTPETEDEYGAGIWITGETFVAQRDEMPEADDRATDGEGEVTQYTIDNAEVFLLVTPYEKGLFLADQGTRIKHIVADFEHGDLDHAQHLASWGFDGTPDAAADDATNVRVWVEPCYYAGTIGAPIGHYARDDQYNDLVFETVADAQSYIDDQESGVYVLSNGEASRPDYTICD